MSVLVIVFSDGSGDKKAATVAAGADFNPEFVSVCSVLLCLSLSPPPLPSPPLQRGGFGRGKPMGAGLGAPL